MKETEKSLESQLWHACAGGMVQMPTVNSMVFYFPQGHAEHALPAKVDFDSVFRIPPLVLCRVAQVLFMADPETDEVYARSRLVPVSNRDPDCADDGVFLGTDAFEPQEKPTSFAKTLTQSDANNGGGFSVPRYCAETIFPHLDYSADPPVQTVVAKDVHGEIWKFRHIYRGTPRRHLLTTGWSTFVNQKKLVAGDSIVFLRAENGDLCVGIRRAKRGIGGASDSLSGWNSGAGNCLSPFGGFSSFFRINDEKLMRNSRCENSNTGASLKGSGRVKPESVVEAAALAAKGQPFEVVYYPRAGTPEFCVMASAVRASMKTHWCTGMRFKMPFETEDSSRISWFLGTISSVQVADPIRWSNSPWRLLEVAWDEPDLLQNVKWVSPWLVELVSNPPTIHLSAFSTPRKKLRILQYPDFAFDGQIPLPSFSGKPLCPSSPMCCLSDSTPAGIQGARHAQLGFSFTDFPLYNKLESGLFPSTLQQFDRHSALPKRSLCNENLSSLLTMGSSDQKPEKFNRAEKPRFLLFGQPILTAQQIFHNCKSDAFSDENNEKNKNSSDGLGSTLVQCSPPETSFSPSPDNQDLEGGHCKVFMDSERVGRTLDLSLIGSYEELYKQLTDMFGMDRSERPSQVLYRDAAGAVKHTGDEPFSDFTRTAKRLMIPMGSGSDDGWKAWMTGVQKVGKNGLGTTNKAGPLSIFA